MQQPVGLWSKSVETIFILHSVAVLLTWINFKHDMEK